MVKSRPSGSNYKGFSDPSVTKIEWYRGHTTRNPVHLKNERVSSSLLSGDLSESKKMIVAQYEKTAKGRFLYAHSIPPIVFDKKSLGHHFSRSNISKQKLSILSDYGKMNQLLSKGTVLEERIRTTSSKGNVKGYKKEWIRLWKVKGRTFIGNKDHTFTFTISQSKNEKQARVYDFKLHRKK